MKSQKIRNSSCSFDRPVIYNEANYQFGVSVVANPHGFVFIEHWFDKKTGKASATFKMIIEGVEYREVYEGMLCGQKHTARRTTMFVKRLIEEGIIK